MLHAAILCLVCCASAAAEPADSRITVHIDDQAGTLTLTIDARVAFVYRFGPTVDLPHFDPFNSPSGRAMTVAITEPFPHHRSFWGADEQVDAKLDLILRHLGLEYHTVLPNHRWRHG